MLISVSPGAHPADVSWRLACGGLPIANGGAPYLRELTPHLVAVGASCKLSMVDAHGDGWGGAVWTGLGHASTLSSGSQESVWFTASVATTSPPPSPPEWHATYSYDPDHGLPEEPEPPPPRPPAPPRQPPQPTSPPLEKAPRCQVTGLCIRQMQSQPLGAHSTRSTPSIARPSRDGGLIIAAHGEWHAEARPAQVDASSSPPLHSWLRLYAVDGGSGYATLMRQSQVAAHSDVVLGVDIDTMGAYVASGGSDGRLILWSTADLVPRASVNLSRAYPYVRAARFDDRGARLLCVSGGELASDGHTHLGRLEIRSVPSLALLAAAPYHEPASKDPARPIWSADGQLIAGAAGLQARIWDGASLRVVAFSPPRPTCGGGLEAPIVALAFVPSPADSAAQDSMDGLDFEGGGAAGVASDGATTRGERLIATLESCSEVQ